jgi:hypothetical protein
MTFTPARLPPGRMLEAVGSTGQGSGATDAEFVLLGNRDDRKFPLIFHRENCADMAS